MCNDSPHLQPRLPGKSPARQMLWLANSYAEGAMLLAQALATGNFTRQYSCSRVVLHLCRQAIELYFKGAIGAKTGKVPGNSHRLDKLYALYLPLYPRDHQQFDIPFSRQVLAGDDDLFPGTMVEYLRTHDQRFRYPTDNNGVPFDESEVFDVNAYAIAVADFRQSISILVARIEFPGGFDEAP